MAIYILVLILKQNKVRRRNSYKRKVPFALAYKLKCSCIFIKFISMAYNLLAHIKETREKFNVMFYFLLLLPYYY
jgi:hypothetical protein